MLQPTESHSTHQAELAVDTVYGATAEGSTVCNEAADSQTPILLQSRFHLISEKKLLDLIGLLLPCRSA